MINSSKCTLAVQVLLLTNSKSQGASQYYLIGFGSKSAETGCTKQFINGFREERSGVAAQGSFRVVAIRRIILYCTTAL